MITLNQYVGVHLKSPDWTPDRQANAQNLLDACSLLEAEMIKDGVKFPTNPKTKNGISGETFGGFRPQDCPIGAPGSSHKEGMAVDRYDPTGNLDAWCMAHQDRLEFYDLYMENPKATPHWSHWTTRRPGSGNRVFMP
jgi:hypothetical protein